MVRWLVRLLGLFAIAGALIALVVDGTRSIAASTLTLTSLGQAWFSFDPDSLAAAQAAVASHVEVYVGAWVWYPVIQFLLTLPVWLVFGALGALLVLAGKPRPFRAAVA
ncbi:hypothetical protein OSH11_17240 [Kaistia dalseonensis]|uniref:Uncharacterized protein n=1 Tax=Kaistia dalseonensis TaxID=410840 RepID=A0ABU0HBC5_9HYPH|nr:hypothetical protein [Kaistia dalseonensis]MCX5496454.1 hypothetical protein [Kaistia dalseonensis]MDQ0439075.1 hypothetical protein [Kaistia dalseonensis]